MEWYPRSPLGGPLGSEVAVVILAAPFPRCPRGGLSSHFPSAFLGRVCIVPLGVVAGRLVGLRTSGEVLASTNLGCLWALGVPVRLCSDTCLGGVPSGGRAAGDDRIRASTFDVAARTLGHPGPRVVSIRGQGISGSLHVVVVFGKDGKD